MQHNSKKRMVCLATAGALLASVFSGCGQKPEEPQAQQGNDGGQETVSLNVGVLPSAMSMPALYAKEQGWFEEEGLDINWVVFPTGAPVNESLSAKQLDIACSGLASVYAMANGTCSLISEVCVSGGDGIYIRPDSPAAGQKGLLADHPEVYGSADTVKGMKLLGPLGTTAQMQTIAYATAFGLGDGEYEQVHMEYGPAYQAFVAGEGDAFTGGPPYTYQLEKEGYVHATSFREITGILLTGVCIARDEVIETKRDAVVKFIKVMYRGADALKADPKLHYDFSMQVYADNAREYDDNAMTKELEQCPLLDRAAITADDYVFGKGYYSIAEFFVEDGKVTEEQMPNVKAALDPSLLEEALGISVKTME